jgi:hypothetical protein
MRSIGEVIMSLLNEVYRVIKEAGINDAGHNAIAGPNWEIYGDWTENPEELTTEVCYLLR